MSPVPHADGWGVCVCLCLCQCLCVLPSLYLAFTFFHASEEFGFTSAADEPRLCTLLATRVLRLVASQFLFVTQHPINVHVHQIRKTRDPMLTRALWRPRSRKESKKSCKRGHSDLCVVRECRGVSKMKLARQLHVHHSHI